MIVTVLYWGAIAVVTHLPPRIPAALPGAQIPHVDRIFHATAYAVLSFLLHQTVAAYRRSQGGDDMPLAWRGSVAVLAIVAVYGAADELTQPFFGRHAEMWDYAFDLFGATLGCAAFRLVSRPRSSAQANK